MNRETILSTLAPLSPLLLNLYAVLISWFCFWVVLSDERSGIWKWRSENRAPQESSLITVRISTASRTARFLLSIGCFVVLVGLTITLYGLHVYSGSGVLICVLAIAWVTDTGAYFAGRAFGKRPFAKRISPHKTIEGTIGGWLLGFVITLILGFWWMQPIVGWTNIVVITMAIAIPIAAIFGDLIESVLKRMSEAKESGKILPGHGGLLDRVDSLIIAVPLVLSFSVLLGNTT